MPRARPDGEQQTRDRLVQLLRHQPRTVEELAAMVGLTRNGVRLQLGALAREGVIECLGVRHGDGPGKPPLVYRVSSRGEAGFSVAYAPALDALVGALGQRLEPAELHSLFAAAGRRLAGVRDRSRRTEPIEAAKRVLESLGAAVAIRREPGQPLVEGVACPLADAVRTCPDSCEMVRALIAATTGARVTTRCEHGGAPRCRFTVA